MGWFSGNDRPQGNSDQQAIERYRYMLRTAPPEAIEKAHEETFAQLTPEQRRLALQQLSAAAPAEERRWASDDPRSLAVLATRTEIRQPGMLERLFGGMGGAGYRSGFSGGGFGAGGFGWGSFAGSLLASIGGAVIGSSIAHAFFDSHPFGGAGFSSGLDSGSLFGSGAGDAGFHTREALDDSSHDSSDETENLVEQGLPDDSEADYDSDYGSGDDGGFDGGGFDDLA